MSAIDLLQRLRAADIHLRLSGDGLAFDAPAGAFSDALKAEVVANKPALIALLRQREATAPVKIPPRPRDKPTPLSFQQQRLWFLDQLEGASSVYNMPLAVDIRGALDAVALQSSLDVLVERHEALRTGFVECDGEVRQDVAEASPLPIRIVDLSALSAEAYRDEAERLRAEEAATPFALDRAGLIRATLLRRDAHTHRLLLTLHHAIADGWSLGVLVHELGACYRAFSTAGDASFRLPPMPCQYGDFAVWQRGVGSARIERQLDYWRERLAGLEPLLELPTDHPRPSRQRYEGDAVEIALPKALVDGLRRLAANHGATLYMVLLSAFNVLLARYAGVTDIAVGTSIANRRTPELERLIGFFVNTLVIRLDLSGAPSFETLLAAARERILEAYEHQDAPFEQVVDALQPPRDLSHSPLIQVMFDLQNLPSRDLSWPGLEFEVLAPVRTTSKFDLTCGLAETDHGIVGHIEYSTHLFDRGTIERMRGHFRTLLEAIVADPSCPIDRLPLLDAQEYATVVRDWNATTRSYPGAATLHARFREQAARSPDAVAAVDHRRRIAYRELDALSTRLARNLREAGVGARGLVAICAERSIEMLVGMLAVLKAGAAYVPMDSSYPPDRLTHMLRDSAAPVLLTQSWLRDKLADAGAASIIDLDAFCTDAAAAPLSDDEQAFAAECCARTAPSEWAYMMYTSGSTGAPKGALVTHAGALNHIDAELDVLGFFDDGTVARPFNFLQSAPASSDISVWQFLAPLMTGGRTAILEDVTDVERMVGVIRDEAIHLIELVPVAAGLLMSHLRSLPQDQRALPSLRYLMATGETVAVELVNDWLALYPAIPVVNAYGPTEAADDITQDIITAPLPAGQHSVSIGRPLPNMRIYILNDAGEPQPIGVPGEICVGGICVGDGYWNKPELTRDRFVPDRFVPNRFDNDDGARARLYRTGDLGRWRADGRIEYIKRRDHQVKIRGFRIELGEIEASLRKCPGVTEVAVVVREDRPGDKTLVGYVTTEHAAAPTSAEMKRFLAERLPMHMVPSPIVRLQAFALLPNGKLDRRNLPVPTAADIETVALVPPSTPMQAAMAKIWREILGIGEVGVDQNFFDLGGHSISATLVAARLRREFGIELPLRDIFLYPTIAQLTEIVVERQLASADSDELLALSASLDALSVEELEQMLLEQSS